jgi:hypothetical protein
MTTLEKLQGLDDGQFHQLVDAILKRVESRYRELRTHGVNDKGISIKGHLDSAESLAYYTMKKYLIGPIISTEGVTLSLL